MQVSTSAREQYPALVSEVSIEPLEERPGSVAITGRIAALEVVLDPGAFWVARAFDGTRTCAQVAEMLARDGLHLGSEEFVLGIAEHLAEVEIVEFFEQPQLASLPAAWLKDVSLHAPLTHRCLGCGRSCQGHWVGPLDRAFIERAPEVHRQMQAMFPDLADIDDPLERMELGSRPVTALVARGPDRSCIYLGEDLKCRIHARLGPEAKPLLCRMFPYTVVLTESGLRIGVSPRCYTYQKTWKGEGGEIDEVTGVSRQELPAPLLRVVLDEPTRVMPDDLNTPLFAFLQQERDLLALLDAPETTLARLLAWTTSQLRGRELEDFDVALFASALPAHLRRLGRAMLEDERAASPSPSPDSHGDRLRRFSAWLKELGPRSEVTLKADDQAYGFHVLAEFVWIRDWGDMSTWGVGILVVAVGLIAAGWYAAEREEDEDAFGMALNVWMRGMGMIINVTRLFASGEEVGRLLDLATSGSGSAQRG